MPREAVSKTRQSTSPIDDESTLRHLISLKIILAADGLHPKEAAALSRGMTLMGIPPALMAEIERFDIHGARLEDYLPRTLSRARARTLLYDAIRLANADQDYSSVERDAVLRAASVLGIDAFTVRAIEGLVQMERAVDQLRRSLLQED